MMTTVTEEKGWCISVIFFSCVRRLKNPLCRQMRQIQDVTSTQDGCHLLILLTDGGVLYFRAGTENASDSQEISEMDDGQSIELNRNGNAARATLTEFSKLSYNPIEDSAWSIKRVAASGTVVLLRASRKEDSGFSTLSVCPLSEEAPEEVADTRLKPGSKWNEWAWFCNTQAMIDAANDSEAESQAAVLRNKDLDMVKLAPSGKPPLNRRGVKKERSVRNDVLPTPLKTDSINDYQTPGVGGPSPVAKYSKHISPADALEKVVFERAHPGSAISRPKKKRVQLSTPAREIGAMEVEFSNSSESSSKRRRSEALGPAMASPLPHIGNITSNYQNTGCSYIRVYMISVIDYALFSHYPITRNSDRAVAPSGYSRVYTKAAFSAHF